MSEIRLSEAHIAAMRLLERHGQGRLGPRGWHVGDTVITRSIVTKLVSHALVYLVDHGRRRKDCRLTRAGRELIAPKRPGFQWDPQQFALFDRPR